ncbi:MAG: TonB family protein [Betaproteobacteria bacterium]|jgi:protein TonB
MSFINPTVKSSSSIVVICAAVLVHLLIIWLLVSGLARKAAAFISEPMNATLIEEIKKVPKPEIPKPKVIPKVYVAKSEVTPPISTSSIQATVTAPPEPPAPSAPPAIVNSAKLDMSGGCQKPMYPEASRQSGEEGAVVVGFLIAVDGKIRESKVLGSSGHRRLDVAAREALGLCKFQAGTGENGQPVESWARIKYVWRLN